MAMVQILPPKRTLEGPSADERMAQLRAQFARISSRNGHPLAPLLQMIYGALIFVAVVLGFSAMTNAHGGFL